MSGEQAGHSKGAVELRLRRPDTHSGDLAHLPIALQPLTRERRWVVWSWAWRDPNWTKPPLQCRDPRSFACVDDPRTWGSYDQAVARWKDGDVDGIGYMLLDAKIGAADLDNCAQRKAAARMTSIDDWARDLRSPSRGAVCG